MTSGNRRCRYYETMWRTALETHPAIVSITSFNEWHEGTQIEEAVPHTSATTQHRYDDYGSREPGYYLQLTKKWVSKMAESAVVE